MIDPEMIRVLRHGMIAHETECLEDVIEFAERLKPSDRVAWTISINGHAMTIGAFLSLSRICLQYN